MKKFISYITSPNLRFVFAALMMLLSSNFFVAQTLPNNWWEQDKSIAYNTPFSYNMNNNVPWELKNAQGQLITSGIGTLSNYTFTIPGSYTLNIIKDPAIDAEEYGNVPNKLNITVNPLKMQFNMSSITFSSAIIGGQSTSNITLSVEADFTSYNGNSVVYDKDFTSSGVDTSIIGKLQNLPVTLQQGTNNLVFKLQGVAMPGNYISFHFIDINGEIQPYDLTYQIP